MSYVWQRWMPAAFRAAGLEVREVDGWENRGRPASTGNYDPDGALTIHHTASTTSPTNPRPTLGLLIAGRSDLPGPLAPYSTGADGAITVIAAGRCNHAGPIGRNGVLGMPYGFDGNALAMGDEVDTNGTQTMPEAQRKAMATAAAVVLDHFGKTPAWVHRHADISGSGKWDLGGITTTQLRELVEGAARALDQEEDPLMAAADDIIKRIEAAENRIVARIGGSESRERGRDNGQYADLRDRLANLAVEVTATGEGDTVDELRARLTRVRNKLAAARSSLDEA